MKFQLLHRAVKGTPVVSLNTVTRVVHIRPLARQIHNARIHPTAAATRPARLRRSLAAATLLFSGPTALLTVYIRIKVQLDLQADKLSVIGKGPFFPQV
jgi:hypothetical protein